MTGLWNDFNDAQSNTNLIPKGTLARVRLTIRPGGFDDPSQGWTGGYATRGSTGAVYLNGEFTVLEGPYARRKIFTLIGLHSPKGPDWANMGRSLVRGMLNSARGISDKDTSPEAQAARRINGFCRSRRARVRRAHRHRLRCDGRGQERDPRGRDARPSRLCAGHGHGCTSSDNLGRLSAFRTGGSGSPLVDVMRLQFRGASAARAWFSV
jgi:hypothetical protein